MPLPLLAPRAAGEQIELARIGRFMNGCGPRRRIQGSQATRTRVLWTLPWRNSYTILSSGSSQTHTKRFVNDTAALAPVAVGRLPPV